MLLTIAFILASGQDAKEDIAKKLSSKNFMERRNAVAKLAELGAKEYAKQIRGLLRDENANVVATAIDALATLQVTDASSEIADRLTDKAETLRFCARRALATLKAKSCAGKVGDALEKTESKVEADELLGLLVEWEAKSECTAIASKLSLLEDAGVNALVKFDARECAPQLGALLRQPLPKDVMHERRWILLKKRTVEVLVEWKAKPQADAIAALASKEHQALWSTVAEALRVLGGNGHAAAVAAMLKKEPQAAIVRCLGALGDKSYAKDIAPLLKSQDHELVAEAAWALGQWQCSDHAEAIATFVTASSDHRARAIAMRALVTLQAKNHAKLLLDALSEGEPAIRAVAALALADLGLKEHAAAIARLLEGDLIEVRLAAAVAIGRLRAADQAQALRNFSDLVDGDKETSTREVDLLPWRYDMERTGLGAIHKRKRSAIVTEAVNSLNTK
jgi:HEAT repeat protein